MRLTRATFLFQIVKEPFSFDIGRENNNLANIEVRGHSVFGLPSFLMKMFLL